ncbi:MAG TPA: sensor histidine kinase [Candidatus Nanoarchaeia archaeon]|nr:sensor histidine kinase [Candidatus Nanoarchaeia archaeon]
MEMPGGFSKLVKSRSFFVVALGFATLIALNAILGLGAVRRARTIYSEMEKTQNAYLQTEGVRRDIAADLYLSDILVRDYLLDPSPQNAPMHRQQLLEIRSSLQQRVDRLSTTVQEVQSPGLERLQEEVEAYWDSLDPMFEWTPEEKAQKSWLFLRRKVLPRRQAVVELSREVSRLNRENLGKERERIAESQKLLRSFLLRMMAFALSFGTVVALLTSYRVAVLERRDDEQRKQIQETENNLRRLSRRLVQTQETERKSLSRELHDEVGQTMTALGIEIGNLQKLRGDPPKFTEHIEEAKQLNVQAMRSLRDLAMGLRPSMLDDLGLGAALQWQGREFSRHTGVPAVVQVDGILENLSEAQRTCIYRVVQEALTNCARHAKAKNVHVALHPEDGRIVVAVQDDGAGFDTRRPAGGLGLLGIAERVESLEGKLVISSQPGKGTLIRVEIPTGGNV